MFARLQRLAVLTASIGLLALFWLGLTRPSRAALVAPGHPVGERSARFLIKPRLPAGIEFARFLTEQQCRVLRSFDALGNVQVLLSPEGRSISEILRACQNSGLVEFAEPDYAVRLASLFPNDPSFVDGTLWGLNNAGQAGGLANADIDAPEAWGVLNSAANVIVAILDTGIRYTHEDLAGNMWTHLPDGNHGINVFGDPADPNDDSGHGTRLAGIIGAMGNNGLGVVGIAWRVQLMACKFLDASGQGSVSDALSCLEYARTNGARIINASWGLNEFSLSLSNAISALAEQGILVVAAAGNGPVDIDAAPFYPACFDLDNIISVTGTDRGDQLSYWSNVGATNVDLAAPGDQIYSTDYASDSAYAYDFGTSMATAYVTGASSLLRAAFPTDTPAQVRSRLLGTVDALPGLTGKCVSGGRLNLRKALGAPLARPLLTLRPAGFPGEASLVLTLGNPGRSYVVEQSTNLWQWDAFSTNLSGLDGSFIVTNNIFSDNQRLFFRARLAP